MMYSFKIEQAIRAAAVLHNGQVRKGVSPYPFITHLVAVAFLLSDYAPKALLCQEKSSA